MTRRKFRGRKETIIRNSRVVSPMEKAIYHQVDGVGPRRIKRQFFELNEQDVTEIGNMLDKHLRDRLKLT